MSLKEQLEARREETRTKASAGVLEAFQKGADAIAAMGLAGLAVGTQAPAFSLPNADGKTVEVGNGPLVLTFYRGHW